LCQKCLAVAIESLEDEELGQQQRASHLLPTTAQKTKEEKYIKKNLKMLWTLKNIQIMAQEITMNKLT
jgi:hypothetical protein